ncbi:hypothetical protein [Cohaesibacter celericrescens]|uniref:Uncharacterized protein n=1 Tax=Cohaesibacter celericrescens TaxID=2067669 RepID=A0A2N5XU45_9HYPH|nr:hypothetical protein [Cohaesibacter celericrescens]PLW78033.1 hypothetical protein C0081_06160 [Cohaesibacter celericrescens]
MTHFNVTPSLAISIGSSPYNPHLLTDERRSTNDDPINKVTVAKAAAPMYPSMPIGSYSQIEAQILAGNSQRTFRRPSANSPRDAARAYGQARRRPQMVSDQPRLQNVV